MAYEDMSPAELIALLHEQDKRLQEQGKQLQEQGKQLQEQGKQLQEQGKQLQDALELTEAVVAEAVKLLRDNRRCDASSLLSLQARLEQLRQMRQRWPWAAQSQVGDQLHGPGRADGGLASHAVEPGPAGGVHGRGVAGRRDDRAVVQHPAPGPGWPLRRRLSLTPRMRALATEAFLMVAAVQATSMPLSPQAAA